MKVKREIDKITKTLDPVTISNPRGQHYQRQILEAQAYLVFMERIAEGDKQLTWKNLKELFHTVYVEMNSAINEMLNAAQRPLEPPLSPKNWIKDLEDAISNFDRKKLIFSFIVEKLRIKYPKIKRSRSS